MNKRCESNWDDLTRELSLDTYRRLRHFTTVTVHNNSSHKFYQTRMFRTRKPNYFNAQTFPKIHWYINYVNIQLLNTTVLLVIRQLHRWMPFGVHNKIFVDNSCFQYCDGTEWTNALQLFKLAFISQSFCIKLTKLVYRYQLLPAD